MRKILLIMVIVLLLVFGVRTVVNGARLGNFEILGIKAMGVKSEELEREVQEVNNLSNIDYAKKQQELAESSKLMKNAREDYLNEISLTSEEDLINTFQIKNFDIERIWAKLGNHALNEGVNINLSLSSASTTGARSMHFVVTGPYVAQTNFLYAIEEDPELNYRIYNYKLVPVEGTEYILEASFSIKETIITKSLKDELNGYELTDPAITDSIFNPEDAVNGKIAGQEPQVEEGGEQAPQEQPQETPQENPQQ